MSFEAESNSELTVLVPAYQLHFRFLVQNKIHKQQIHYCILIWPWFCSLQNSRTHRPWKLLTRYAQWRRVKWSMHKVGGREGGRNIIMDVIITMETVACLRSKCHLKQNLIPSWPCSFRHTNCISDFWCKTKYTNNKFCC
jgi:hypothetical protein